MTLLPRELASCSKLDKTPLGEETPDGSCEVLPSYDVQPVLDDPFTEGEDAHSALNGERAPPMEDKRTYESIAMNIGMILGNMVRRISIPSRCTEYSIPRDSLSIVDTLRSFFS